MPAPIRRLTVDEFSTLLRLTAPTLTRRIDAVHVHHTWRPTRSQFKGLATIEAIRNFHVKTNGWDDIAQHLTIDPQGFTWTGRNWNAPPASQKGKNGNAAQGPFMIEVVGDFDAGRDPLDGDQRRALVRVIAALLSECRLTVDDIRFHRELGSPKTCPGTSVDKDTLLQEVRDALPAAPAAARAAKTAKGAARALPPFDVRFVLGYDLTTQTTPPPEGFEEWEIQEHEFVAEAVREDTRARVRARGGLESRDLGAALRRGGEWEVLRPHVINLTKGRLSQSGEFEMPDGSIEFIVDSIRQYAESTATPRLMVHAHGGLVGERTALTYARDAHQWWLQQGVYPVFFVWETSVFEVIKQRLGLARGFFADGRDFAFEQLADAAGGDVLWGDMKESARLASAVDAGSGEAGGARIFADALAPMLKSNPGDRRVSIHAVGHSAGAIFQAHWLPLLLAHGLDIDSLALLAPAVRTDVFKEKLFAPIDSGRIKAFTMYTMEQEAELDDDLVQPLGITLYGKSLLYLVSRAFEPMRETPLLGLHEMIDADPDVAQLLKAPGRLELSRARGNDPNPATTALMHGCFDNDPATMASVFKTITGAAPVRPFPAEDRSCDRNRSRALRLSAAPLAGPAFAPGAPAISVAGLAGRTSGGARKALCVGIDNYRDSPLAGCVRDATLWASVLGTQQFDVTTVLDRDATRARVLDALRALVTGARAGDVIVFQYAGHGTQTADLNGDESDRFDEAIVPVDYHTGALLLDDDLADVYRQLPAGVVLTLFMDCCNSGTNSRFSPIDRTQPRGSERRRFLELPPEVEEAHRRFRAREGSPPPTSPEESLPGVVHFAACLDNQFAYESAGQGHFTKVATAALTAALARGMTNEDFASDVGAKVIALGRPQTPRLMRLPADLSGRPLLSPASGVAPQMPNASMPSAPSPLTPSPLAPPSASRDADEWWLQFFEAGAAYWRQRMGR